MATPTKYEVKKDGETEPCGAFTKDELERKLTAKEVSAADFFRDQSKPDGPWRRLSEVLKASNNQASGPHADHTGVSIPVASAKSHALPIRQPPARPQPISSTPISGDRAYGTRPPAGSTALSQKEKVGIMAIAGFALALTLVNMGWLLFAGASHVQPANAAPQASAQTATETKTEKPASAKNATVDRKADATSTKAASPERESGPDAATTSPPRKVAPPDRAEPGDTATKPAIATSDKDDQGFTGDGSVEVKIDNLIERVDRMLKHSPLQAKRALFLDAVEAGEWRYRIGDVDFIFIYIPAGTFLFGYAPEDQDRVIRATGNPTAFLNASPMLQVHVSRGFFMLDREITASQWEVCMLPIKDADAGGPTGKAPMEPGMRELPKRKVSWLEAMDFCRAFQKAAQDLEPGWSLVRLPTEIEWEYAARGAQSALLPWAIGSNNAEIFLGNAQSGTGGPIAVDPTRTRDVSWRRQFNFAGNLAEWCLDRYEQELHEGLAQSSNGKIYSPWADELVGKGVATSKTDPNPSRAFRGGAFTDPAANCELPMRRYLLQNTNADHVGFRPVIVLNDGSTAAPAANANK